MIFKKNSPAAGSSKAISMCGFAARPESFIFDDVLTHAEPIHTYQIHNWDRVPAHTQNVTHQSYFL